jgi:hypothetical protein
MSFTSTRKFLEALFWLIISVALLVALKIKGAVETSTAEH